MAIITSSTNPLASGPPQILTVGDPAITTAVATLADTEYSLSIPADTRKFFLNARGSAKLRLAFTLGGTSTSYKIIRAGFTYESPALNGAALTLYIQSDQAGETIELETWV